MLDIHIRMVTEKDLGGLLALYEHLHPTDAPLPPAEALNLVWADILADPKLRCFVAAHSDRLIASCTLVLVPNLTRGARPYGLIENVVTHPDFRRQGIATQLLRHALETAWQAKCYKVMLLTGSKRAETLRFYE